MTEPSLPQESIFLQALEISSAAERAAFLERACGGDASLLAEVQALLRAHGQAGDLLDLPEESAVTLDEPAMTERPGTVIGPYKLLQQIGEGGMGVVFMAEQTQPVQRKVALKLIKSGMDSRQVIARFEAERQALALMDHPNIARVLDAGTTESGRPYFVMELVKGVPITRYCDEHHLTPRERLELFVPVCLAVQHAHHKGIIHRDMKPSNVMVCTYDGKPVPKVIDFGVAKATGTKLTDRTLFTEFGAIVGTFEYMSPEQAELDQLDVDTRSDVYSLGVLLYELLTGTTPLERKRMKEVAILELLRRIREEEAPRPSVRLSTTEGLPSIAANRGTEPRRMSGLMRGELDWIVMKCLDKDRNRRYETANAFAADVLHFLHGESVFACPPSASYRMRKFARRNRAALLTTGVVVMALVMGTGISIWQAVRATRALEAESLARQDADTNLQTARQAVDDYFTVVSDSPLLDAPGLEPLRKQLLETALSYNRDFIEKHTEDPNLQADVAAAQIRVAEITYLVGGSSDEWFPHVREGVDIIARLIEEHRDTPEVQARLAKIHLSIGEATAGGSVDIRDEVRCFEKLVKNWEKLIRDNPAEPEFQNGLAGTYFYLAALSDLVSDQIHWSDKAVQIWEKLARDHPRAAGYRMHLAMTHERRASFLIKAGRGQPADKEAHEALLLRQELARDFPGRAANSVWQADSLRALGELQFGRHEHKEAEKSLRLALELQEKLVTDFPSNRNYQQELAKTQQVFGAVLEKLNRSSEAELALRQAFRVQERLVVAFPKVVGYQNQLLQNARALTHLLEVSGQTKKKKEVSDEVFAVYAKLTAQSSKSPDDLKAMATVYQNLANLLRDSGQPQEGEKAYANGLELLRKRAAEFPAGPGCREDVGHGCRMFVYWLPSPEKNKECAELLREASTVFESLAADFPNAPTHRCFVADTQQMLGKILFTLKLPKEAEESYRKATRLFDTLPANVLGHPERRAMMNRAFEGLANLLKSSGRQTEAEGVLHEAIDIYKKLAAAQPTNLGFQQELARQCIHLALHLREVNKSEEATKTVREASNLLEKLATENPGEPSFRVDLGHGLWQLAGVYSALGQQGEAEKLHRQSLGVFEKLASEFPPGAYYRMEQGFCYWNLGWLLKNSGRPEEAEEFFRRSVDLYTSLAAEVPNEMDYRVRLSASYQELFWILLPQGKEAAAEKILHQALTAREKWAADFPAEPTSRDSVARGHYDLARLLKKPQAFPEKEKEFREAIAIWEKLAVDVPSQPIYRVHAAYAQGFDLGPALAARGQLQQAEEATRLSFRMFEKLASEFPKDGHEKNLTDCQFKLAGLLWAAGRFQEAERTYTKNLELAPKNALTMNELAWLLATCADFKLRDPGRAVKIAKQAVELAPKEGSYWNTLGVAYYRAGDWKQASAAIEKSMGLGKGSNGCDWLACDWLFLAMVRSKLDQQEEARKWYDKAVAWIEKNAPKHGELIRVRTEANEQLGIGTDKH